jgi:hypothetical protein
MKKINKRLRPSPASVVTATTLCVILLVIVSTLISAHRNRINARVEIADPMIESSDAQAKKVSATFNIPDGEVERTAVRVREASALVMGLTLTAVNEALARRLPQNVETLIGIFVEQNLLPPGIRFHNQKGILESDHATIYVRYRPEPLAIEIVSIGRAEQDGPPIIARIVTGVDDNSGAALFIAKQIKDSSIPAPFLAIAQVAAMNWSVEPLREPALSPKEIEQVNAWLQSREIRK